MKRIVTHPGNAHADEFIACSLLLASASSPIHIERREPRPDDLTDTDTCVVDVGGRHEPDSLNFDHHAVVGLEDQCSIDLVLTHLGVRETACVASLWLKFKTNLDCYGPFATAAKFGMSVEALYATVSPIETFVLREFAELQVIEPQMHLWDTMYMFGKSLISHWDSFQAEMELAQSGLKIIIGNLTFVDFRPCGPLMIPVTSHYLSQIQAAGSVVTDDRGENCDRRAVLYRHADHPAVDFRRIAADRMHYIHHNGFLAKTKEDVTDKDIHDLLRIAVAHSELSLVTPSDQLQLRQNVRNFLMTATLEQLQSELKLSTGYRAQFVQELLDEQQLQKD